MKQFFKKDCIYQKNPTSYFNFPNSGLGAYGIDSAAGFNNAFVPMGDIIKNDLYNKSVYHDINELYPTIKLAW